MLKKAVAVIMILSCVLSLGTLARAEERPYFAEASRVVAYAGEAISFDISTPADVFDVKVYADNKLCASATPASSEAAIKHWQASAVFETSGLKDIEFRAYSQEGKLLESFSPLKLRIKHLLPVAEPPIIMDCDKAVLLGTAQYCGQTFREYGFNLGTSPMALNTKIRSNRLIRGKMNKLVTDLLPGTTYYYQAYVVAQSGTIAGSMVSFTMPQQQEWSAQDAVFEDSEDRYNYIFGTDTKYYTKDSPPFGFVGWSEAATYMVRVTVPIWRMSGSRRSPGKWTFSIHYKLENNIKAIFDEIYALDIQFPVMKLYTFDYRTINGPGLKNSPILSHHSFGTAIDINKPYNLFYKTVDKRDPKNPYTIPPEVIAIFEKYGWAWGGNLKEGIDTMHFQYLGLELTES